MFLRQKCPPPIQLLLYFAIIFLDEIEIHQDPALYQDIVTGCLS